MVSGEKGILPGRQRKLLIYVKINGNNGVITIDNNGEKTYKQI